MMSNTRRLFKRAYYTVAVESVKGQAAAVASSSVMRREAAAEDGAGGGKAVERDVFWMRDPKTGNWIPETHFHEIDIAELRDKLLPCKPKF